MNICSNSVTQVGQRAARYLQPHSSVSKSKTLLNLSHTAEVCMCTSRHSQHPSQCPGSLHGRWHCAVTWSHAMFLGVSTSTPACTSAPFTGGHPQPRLTRHSSISSATECLATRDKLSSQLEASIPFHIYAFPACPSAYTV